MTTGRKGLYRYLILICASVALTATVASSSPPITRADIYYDTYTWPGSTSGWSAWSNDNPYTMSMQYPPPFSGFPVSFYGPSVTPTPPAAQQYTQGRGIWSYEAPGTTTISAVTFKDIWQYNPNQKQCLRVALYKNSPIWQDGDDLCDNGQQHLPEGIGLDDPDDASLRAQLWLHTMDCTPNVDCPTIPPWTFFGSSYAHAGSVELELSDHETPTAQLAGYLKDHNGDWLQNTGIHNTTVQGTDPGSGIKSVALYANSDEPVATSAAPCDPTHNTYPAGAVCPAFHAAAWPVNLASYGEGPLYLDGEAVDLSQEQGFDSPTVYIDTAPPEIELSNVLPQLKDLWVTSASNHEITVGGYDSGSGIKKIQLLTNDPIHGTQVVNTHNSTCNFGAPNGEYCPLEDEATWELDLTDYPQGEMTVTAKVEDLTGRITEESFNIKVDTQPPPEPEGEEVEGEDGGATITWDPVELEPDDTGSPLKGYVVRYSVTGGQSWEPWQETTNTSKHVTDVPVGTEVQFEVQSEDEAGWYSDATTASGDAYTAKGKKQAKKASPKNTRAKIAKKKSTRGGRPSDFVPWTYETRDKWKKGESCHGSVDGGEVDNIKDPINIVVYNGANWESARFWSRSSGTDWLPDDVKGGKQCAWVRAVRNPHNVDIGTEDCSTCPRYHARLFETMNPGKTWTAIAVHHDAKNHKPDNKIRWPHAKEKLLVHFRYNGCSVREKLAVESTAGPSNSDSEAGFGTKALFQDVENDGYIAYIDKQTCNKKKGAKIKKKVSKLRGEVKKSFNKLFNEPLKFYAKSLIKKQIKPKYQGKVKNELDRAIESLNKRLRKKYLKTPKLQKADPAKYKKRVDTKASKALKKYIPKVKKAIESIAKLKKTTKANIRKKLRANGLLPKKPPGKRKH